MRSRWLGGWVEFLHVPVPFHLGLVPVDTTFHLNKETLQTNNDKHLFQKYPYFLYRETKILGEEVTQNCHICTILQTSFYLASEGKQILVDVLGRKTVACMLLSLLDVPVHFPLRLKPVLAALIGAGERALACVIHLVLLQSMSGGESR